jgi:hypothetical protein
MASDDPRAMTLIGPSVRPGWFFVLLAAYTALELAWLGWLAADFVTHPWAPDYLFGSAAYRLFLGLVLVPATVIVALLVLRRTPGNVTGLCLLLASVLIMGATLRVGSPLAPYNGTLNTGWMGLWLLPLYFPDGLPQPRRFGQWIRVLSALCLVSSETWGLFQPESRIAAGLIANPLFVPALGPLQPLASGLQPVLLLLVVVLIVPSLIWRYRASSFSARQQLKWLVWAFALLILITVPVAALALIEGRSDPFAGVSPVLLFGFVLYVYLMPFVAVGNAILRHRLYDIDVIIRRTLVYSVLTALLALAYLGSVVVLQGVLQAVAGQRNNQFEVVASTLAIAALFVPLRRRVQTFIDRRFYRRRYDAARILQAFGSSIRDDVDLEGLTERLVGVVQESMQPANIVMWLRKDAPE